MSQRRLAMSYRRPIVPFLALWGMSAFSGGFALGQSPACHPDVRHELRADSGSPGMERIAEALRQGELCGDRNSLSRALELLEPLLFKRTASSEAWYLAGRARLALSRLGAVAGKGAGQLAGMTYAESAVAALRRALSLDPAHAAAAALLADPELRRLARHSVESDIDLIRRASANAPHDEALLLRRARLELDVGRFDSALAASDRLLAHTTDSALALRERARALLMLHRVDEGYRAYLEGLRRAVADSSTQPYRDDLAWIASEGELSAFDALTGNDRANWVDEFWIRRAAADFQAPAERLAEHQRRIGFALAEFPLRSGRREYNAAMPYRSGQSLVDDRGVVYIRHGAPSRIFRSGSESVTACPVYSWLYEDGADRGLTTHFRPYFTLQISEIRFCSYSDFKLVPGGIWIDGNAGQLAAYDSLYARWVGARNRPVLAGRLSRELAREEIDRLSLAVTSDAHPRRFERDLHAVVRAYGLTNPERMLIAFGLPHEGLGRIHRGTREVYPVRLRVAVIPRGAGMPILVDTTLMYDASRSLRSDQWIVGYIEVPMPAGTFEVRSLVVGADPTAGSFGLQLPVLIPAFVRGSPSVSALVLGTPESELRWPTPAGSFPLSPLNAYSRRTPIEILLVADGFPTETAVTVNMRLAPVRDPAHGQIELNFVQRSEGGRLVLRQTVGLETARPGLHDLIVTIGSGSGPSASHTQRIAINP